MFLEKGNVHNSFCTYSHSLIYVLFLSKAIQTRLLKYPCKYWEYLVVLSSNKSEINQIYECQFLMLRIAFIHHIFVTRWKWTLLTISAPMERKPLKTMDLTSLHNKMHFWLTETAWAFEKLRWSHVIKNDWKWVTAQAKQSIWKHFLLHVFDWR